MTKLLVLSRYDRQGASSRLRTMQYIPHLRSAGLDVEVSSLFDASYLNALYNGRRQTIEILGHYFTRLKRLVGPRPDVIWLEKETFPWLPWALEKQAWPSGIPVVADYDDALFHRYDQHALPMVRRLLGQKIDKVMAQSAVVTAGNSYLADRAKLAGASRVEIVPTVVDLEAYNVNNGRELGSTPRIGWIGTPQTWKTFGKQVFDLVRHTARESGAVFRAVGSGEIDGDPREVEFFDWSEETEVRLIQGMDVGIMPLADTPWARGKCGYKLVQYMACGLPVIASPVGVNRDIVEHGVNGFLAENDGEWKAALDALLGNPALRQKMGAAGRLKVEQRYSLQVWGPRVADMLVGAAKGTYPRA